MDSMLSILTRDGLLLFSTRVVRLFAYGFLSVVLVLYLSETGLGEAQIGLLLALTLLGDTLISLWMTTVADRWGRRSMLMAGAGLMVFASVLFVMTNNFSLLLIAAIIGVISPSGSEVGPFLSIEQAALSQLIPNASRTKIFAWYNLVGSLATALGALLGGTLAQALQNSGFAGLESYRSVVMGYGLLGLVLSLLFTRLSANVEVAHHPPLATSLAKNWLGLHRSRRVVMKLSTLFALDSFAGGIIIQSILAYWFYLRFGAEPALLGAIFFGGNVLAGVSALAAARLAARIGLINTMVFTHIPSNILLILVPFMPNLALAITVLLARFSISQMDVPTRQSYTMAVVAPDERSAAAGITGVARTTGAALAPILTGSLLANPAWMSLPFILAGGIKIVYDLLLYRSFRALKPPEETGRS
jgi:MFS family permease